MAISKPAKIIINHALLATVLTIFLLAIGLIKLNGLNGGIIFVTWLSAFGVIFFAWVMLTKDLRTALNNEE